MVSAPEARLVGARDSVQCATYGNCRNLLTDDRLLPIAVNNPQFYPVPSAGALEESLSLSLYGDTASVIAML